VSTHNDRDLSLFGVTLREQGGGVWRSCSSRILLFTFSPRNLDISFISTHNISALLLSRSGTSANHT
jgi:hypothetical protein